MCGELAGDPAAAVLLAGLGVTELSMAPALVPEVKAGAAGGRPRDGPGRGRAALEAPDAATARAFGAEVL